MERINIVKISILPKIATDSNYQYHFSKKTFKICMKTQKKLESIINTEGEKNGARRMRFPDFRLSYKAIVIKTVWYQHRNRNINQ